MTSKLAGTAWHVMTGGVLPRSIDKDRRRIGGPEDFQKYQIWKAWLSAKAKNPDASTDTNPHIDWFERSHRVAVVERSLVTTRKGFIGLAPKHTKRGDLVSVVAGGNVPHVLRREHGQTTPNTSDTSQATRYRVLGDAFVHGIMDGEVFALLERAEGEFDERTLRWRSEYSKLLYKPQVR